MKYEKHFHIESPISAVNCLKEGTELSKQAIKQVMSKGAVWLTRANSTQRIRRFDKSLLAGDDLHLYYDEEVLARTVTEPILISDEDSFSIWFKPYGMLCQGSKWGDHCTINRWAEQNLKPQRPSFIVHRLDKAATGLIILAHQKKVAAYFSDIFQNRKIEKTYQAIVHGQFPALLTLDSDVDGKHAKSHGRSVFFNQERNQTLIEVSIETGRKHQIRIHLSQAGFPIVGDRLYGKEQELFDRDLCLRSCYLSFLAPNTDLKNEYSLTLEQSLSF